MSYNVKVLGFGDNVVDKYEHIKTMYPGGNAVNFAVFAKKLGAERSAYMGIFGSDKEAEHVIASLQEEGVELVKCKQVIGENGAARVTVNPENGDRIFLGSNEGGIRGDMLYALDRFSIEYVKGFDLVHSGNYCFTERELPKIKAAGVPISFDFSDDSTDEYYERIAPLVDYAFMSCGDITKEETYEKLKKVSALGPKFVCASRGDEGCIAFDGNEFYMPRCTNKSKRRSAKREVALPPALRHSEIRKEGICMEKTVAAVGFCCADVYEKLNKFYPTGNGIDWGVHLARMGVPVSVVSVVGTDSYGEKMKEALAAEHIDISHLRTEEGDTCKMMMDLKNGTDRVHLEEIEGVMKNYALTEEEFNFVARHSMLHTDLFGKVLDKLPAWKEKGVEVVMDFSVFSEDPEYECEKLFPYVDYVFLSYDGKKDDHIKEWVKKIHSYGPKLVTATMGELGSICYDGTTLHEFGIVPTRVVNTVGAGDSYIAGFTYGILNGWSVPACMQKGAEVSSAVVSKFEPY